MKILLQILLIIFQVQWINAQEVAPNFILTDIDGETHELYEYLDQGKSVVLDFYAVWCGPCQQNAAGVEAVWETLGLDGTNEVMILGIEADDTSTDQEVIDYAVDWNCNNPQINTTGDVPDIYGIEYYPTYLIVCPDRTYLEYSGGPNEIESILTDGIGTCASAGNSVVDARIFDYNSTTMICSNETTPNITLMNMGQQSLTSVEIKTYLNGNLQSEINWNGDLVLYEFTDVSLPPINIEGVSAPEISVVLENPNNMIDSNLQDNTISVEIEGGGATYITDSIHFQLYFDNFPQETEWEILNSIGEVIIGGDDYVGFPDFSAPIDTFLALTPGDCYTFNIYDSAGDGICCSFADPDEGFWKIFTDSEELIAEGGTFTYQESALFGIEQLVGHFFPINEIFNPIIYPNPANLQITIENVKEDYQWEILSVDGRTCLNGLSFSESSKTINVADLSSGGIYILKIETETQSSCHKLIIE